MGKLSSANDYEFLSIQTPKKLHEITTISNV